MFGSYAKDRDWPNHVLSITTIIDPRGEVVGRHWKARNIKGLFGRFEVFTTTIYDVLDEYVEKYGREEVVPVTRTPVGNICTTSTQLEPEIIRAFALRGGEIMLRTATGGFDEFDIQANARYNNMYTAIVNQAISRDNPGSFEGRALRRQRHLRPGRRGAGARQQRQRGAGAGTHPDPRVPRGPAHPEPARLAVPRPVRPVRRGLPTQPVLGLPAVGRLRLGALPR